jgi:hypothetical protein
VILAVLALVAGCGSSGDKRAKPSPTTHRAAPVTYTDPCATTLHDLCGPLLLYYAVNRKLPADAEELRRVESFPNLPELRCPVSDRPYVYTRAGLGTPGGGGRVILHDATAAHDGKRWAIAIQETSNPNEPLIAKVISLPDSFFKK